MADRLQNTTWQENPTDIIVLTNQSSSNYILELPSGRFRLDAGRRMLTLKSILNLPKVKQLVDDGSLRLETYDSSYK